MRLVESYAWPLATTTYIMADPSEVLPYEVFLEILSTYSRKHSSLLLACAGVSRTWREATFDPLVLRSWLGDRDPAELLQEAAEKGDCAAVALLRRTVKQEAFAALARTGTISTLTPLHIACRDGHAGIVKVLSEELTGEEFATLAAMACSKDLTPLYFACRGGHADVVRALAEGLGDPEAFAAIAQMKSVAGYTPLFVAHQYGPVEVMRARMEVVEVLEVLGISE